MEVATNVAGLNVPAAATTVVEMDAGVGGVGIAIGILPAFTALAAAETVTATIVRTDTGAIIGSSTFTNSGAGASTGGPLVVIAPLPVGLAGPIALQIIGSVATGAATGTATAPISLTRLP